jgi:hypothetical protein
MHLEAKGADKLAWMLKWFTVLMGAEVERRLPGAPARPSTSRGSSSTTG